MRHHRVVANDLPVHIRDDHAKRSKPDSGDEIGNGACVMFTPAT